MFAKGNRFPQRKPSDIPGPGSYDPRDPNYDAYKHGAFLEKEERFLKEKFPEVPGSSNTEQVLVKKPTTGTAVGKTLPTDHSATLQRKVDELERLYTESRKSHQAEVDKLKGELSRSQKAASEQADRMDKLRKQKDASEARLQELRKINLSDQSEIKDLRAKLRVSEHERAQLASKHGETSDMKKAIQALDTKRREELRERDKRISELEKAVAVEKRRKDALESTLAETKSNTEAEIRNAVETKKALDSELRETRNNSEQARSSLAILRTQAQDKEDELLAQLEQHRSLLSQVAEDYGRLVASTVSRVDHERVQSHSRVLQLRVTRLERKLANSEDQVIELANLIRSTKEHSKLLARQLQGAEMQLAVYSVLLNDMASERLFNPLDLQSVQEEVSKLKQEFAEDQEIIRAAVITDATVWANYDRARSEHLLLHATLLGRQIDEAQHLVQKSSQELLEAQSKLSAVEAELLVARSEQEVAKKRWADATAELSVSQAREESLRKELQSVKAGSKAELAKLQRSLKEEKETTQKLASVVQTSKAAADALNDEIEQLTADLAEAEKYQEAYTGLLEEVDSLVEKNALAEEEAQRLSTFNAQILGHHNPAQRIMYVDKIRKELHDTKLELLSVVRERDNVIIENEEIRHELNLYTSIAVPQQSKPRTTVTRVTRVPLASQSLNGQSLFQPKSTSSIRKDGRGLESPTEISYKEGDMTLDEIS